MKGRRHAPRYDEFRSVYIIIDSKDGVLVLRVRHHVRGWLTWCDERACVRACLLAKHTTT